MCQSVSLFWKTVVYKVGYASFVMDTKIISDYLKSALSGEPIKNDEKCFLFHLKSSFRSRDI